MMDTDQIKSQVQKKVDEIIMLFQNSGYQYASVDVMATPEPYTGHRRIDLSEEYDWSPSESWSSSSC